MSGGSYNYLYGKDFPDIITQRDELENMRDRLAELGFNDLAKETNNILQESIEIEKRMNERIDKIKKVWHSVEYMDSGDSGIDWVNTEVANFRGVVIKESKGLTNRQIWAINYLQDYKDTFISPTQLGNDYGIAALNRSDCHSSTGSPILKSLEAIGKVVRNDRGWYKLKE